MAAANYNRPKPADPIYLRARCYVRIMCVPCKRQIVMPLGEFANCLGVSLGHPHL